MSHEDDRHLPEGRKQVGGTTVGATGKPSPYSGKIVENCLTGGIKLDFGWVKPSDYEALHDQFVEMRERWLKLDAFKDVAIVELRSVEIEIGVPSKALKMLGSTSIASAEQK